MQREQRVREAYCLLRKPFSESSTALCAAHLMSAAVTRTHALERRQCTSNGVDPPVRPQQLLRAQAGAPDGTGGDVENVVAGIGVPLEALQGLCIDPAIAAVANAQQPVVRLPCRLQLNRLPST